MTPSKGKATKSPKKKSDGGNGTNDGSSNKSHDQIVADAIKKTGGKRVRDV